VAQTLTAQEARKRGRSWWIRCPFHKGGAERTPSLEILLPGKGWRCHACHAGGDAVTFVARLRGLGNAEALFFLEKITDTCPAVWEVARRG
jgi:DNA primase